jgi:hypothetical protein
MGVNGEGAAEAMSQSDNIASEDDRAAFYEAHKDDDEVWEDEGDRRGSRQLDTVASIRLSREEAATLRAAARERGMTLSAFLRAAGLSEAGRAPTVDRKTVADTLQALADQVRSGKLMRNVRTARQPTDPRSADAAR